MKPPLPPVTAEQLALAWRHMRRPAHWPSTLEAALEDPGRRSCITGYARAMARAPFRPVGSAPAHRLPRPPVPPTPTHPPLPRRADTRFDARKAAANDLKDD